MRELLNWKDYCTHENMSSDKQQRWLLERLNSPEFLKDVITQKNAVIVELKETIISLNKELNAPLMLKIKWKLASLMNKLPKIRIEW